MNNVEAGPAAALMLTRLARLHESLVQEECDRHDLSSADFRVLALLHLHGADRPASPTMIASWIVQTSGGLTATLRRLADRSLVERLDDPSDGRGKLVAITPAGQALYKRLFGDVMSRFSRLTEGVDLDAVLAAIRPLIAAYEHDAGRAQSTSWDATRAALDPTNRTEESA